MRDLRRITGLAIVLVVLLRISIGWQFLYEGLWKIDSMDTATPWTSEGYLKNAQGPFRSFFRGMTGDPDDLSWLDYGTVAGRWDAWKRAFEAHHPDLSKEQKQKLDRLLEPPKAYFASLEKLPESVEFRGSLARAVQYDEKGKRLVVDGSHHLTPDERDRLLTMVRVDEEGEGDEAKRAEVLAFQKAVRDVYDRQSRHASERTPGLTFKERLKVALQQNPDRAGVIVKEKDGATVETRLGDIAVYKSMLERYERDLAHADSDFKWTHLNDLRGKIQMKRAQLVGPVKALDEEFKTEALRILKPQQLARGPVPVARTQLERLDWLTMWSLTIIGALLIAGFFTPFVALAGAALLTMFYLVIPPWTGVPEAPGPEHSWIVNKNFIEALALLAIAAMPTGRWFGVDSIFNWLWLTTRWRKEPQPIAVQPAAGAPTVAPAKSETKGRQPVAPSAK